ncbi:MAG: 23S rRNA (pseudouridine(1915)-N(3))-methyltransferase RlmH [Vampirovibrionales bacterium]
MLSAGKPSRALDYFKAGEADYTRRLKPYGGVILHEVADCPVSPTVTVAQALEIEAERLTPYLQSASYIITLAIEGKSWTSEALPSSWNKLAGFHQRILQTGVFAPGPNRLFSWLLEAPTG